jgi:hypothetical protein
MDRASYQAPEFVVAEIGGHVLSEFVALGESAQNSSPEILLMRTAAGRWHRCFLDASLGFWDVLSDDQAAEAPEDYDGVARVDLLKRFSLAGHRVLHATCDRTAAEGTRISIVFEKGSVVLRESDQSNPDSVSALEFLPR